MFLDKLLNGHLASEAIMCPFELPYPIGTNTLRLVLGQLGYGFYRANREALFLLDTLPMDYRDLPDHELDAMFRGQGGQADYPAIVAEHQRRQNLRESEAARGRHKESQTLGQKILFWARWTCVAAVVVPVVVALLSDIHISKSRPAKSSRASPTSSKRSLASIAATEAPTATESPSTAPTASPTPLPSSTPE